MYDVSASLFFLHIFVSHLSIKIVSIITLRLYLWPFVRSYFRSNCSYLFLSSAFVFHFDAQRHFIEMNMVYQHPVLLIIINLHHRVFFPIFLLFWLGVVVILYIYSYILIFVVFARQTINVFFLLFSLFSCLVRCISVFSNIYCRRRHLVPTKII